MIIIHTMNNKLYYLNIARIKKINKLQIQINDQNSIIEELRDTNEQNELFIKEQEKYINDNKVSLNYHVIINRLFILCSIVNFVYKIV